MNGAAPVTASGVKPRRLVLHFDINKTIVMKDPSNNVNNSTLTVIYYLITFIQACNLLANLVWGKLVPKKVNGVEDLQWTYVSD